MIVFSHEIIEVCAVLFTQDQLWMMGIIVDLLYSTQVKLANVVALVIDVVQVRLLAELRFLNFGPSSDLRAIVRLDPLHHIVHVLFVQPHGLVSLVDRKEAVVALD